MTFKKIHLLLLIGFIAISCNNKKEEELQLRERQLELREQQLLAKEQDYEKLLQMRDSLVIAKSLASDTIVVVPTWPDTLQQVWNSKMTCRESNCSNYVIGDQRNEVWKFLSDSTGLYMNVINNDRLVRIFRARYDQNKILMEHTSDSTSKTKVKTNIVLDDIQQKIIKGTQIITGQNNCTARFAIELTPSTKK